MLEIILVQGFNVHRKLKLLNSQMNFIIISYYETEKKN